MLPTNQTQYLIGSKTEIIQQKIQSMLGDYQIQQELLFIIKDQLINHLEQNYGVITQYVDSIREEADNSDHDETATCDNGVTMTLLKDLSKHAGIVTQLYDILHLWWWHMLQWAMESDPGDREYWWDKAFEIGAVFHVWASQEKLEQVRQYEEEGWRMGLWNLKQTMELMQLNLEIQSTVMRFYNDYQQNDLNYLLNYYRTGKSINFFENRQNDLPTLPLLPVPSEVRVKTRPPLGIGVIRAD